MNQETFNQWVASTTTKPTEPNRLIGGMAEPIYNAAPGVRSSTLKKYTPKEMRFSMMTYGKDTYATTLGTLVHALTLEHIGGMTDISEIVYVVDTKGITTKEADQARLEFPDHIVATREMLIKAERMRDAILEHRFAEQLLRCRGRREVSAFAWDEEAQVLRKARLDMLPDDSNYLLDIKTTDDITEYGFKRSIKSWSWHMSQAYYMDILEAIEGKQRQLCYLIGVTGPKAQAQSPDDGVYMANVFEIASDGTKETNFIHQGRKLYREALHKLSNAMLTNTWEAYEHQEPNYLTAYPYP
jgi:exodeoxyribonuclease VIII